MHGGDGDMALYEDCGKDADESVTAVVPGDVTVSQHGLRSCSDRLLEKNELSYDKEDPERQNTEAERLERLGGRMWSWRWGKAFLVGLSVSPHDSIVGRIWDFRVDGGSKSSRRHLYCDAKTNVRSAQALVSMKLLGIPGRRC